MPTDSDCICALARRHCRVYRHTTTTRLPRLYTSLISHSLSAPQPSTSTAVHVAIVTKLNERSLKFRKVQEIIKFVIVGDSRWLGRLFNVIVIAADFFVRRHRRSQDFRCGGALIMWCHIEVWHIKRGKVCRRGLAPRLQNFLWVLSFGNGIF